MKIDGPEKSPVQLYLSSGLADDVTWRTHGQPCTTWRCTAPPLPCHTGTAAQPSHPSSPRPYGSIDTAAPPSHPSSPIDHMVV